LEFTTMGVHGDVVHKVKKQWVANSASRANAGE
jgi:hypothetical protein